MQSDRGDVACDITRRHALKIVLRGGLVLVGAWLADQGAKAAPSWVRVGKASQFKVGVPKKVTLPNGTRIFVLRQPANRWLALSTRCTHEGGEVEWNAARKRFVCPLHQATFRADGTSPSGPARAPLAKHPSQNRNEVLLVDLSSATGPAGANRARGGAEEEHEREHGRRERRRGEERHGERREHERDDDD